MTLRDMFLHTAWWGKILGAFFGFLIAGPLGACVGILIGNLFDRAFAQHLGSPLWPYLGERDATTKRNFFEATFLVMGHIAKADGRVSEEEIALARQFMEEMRLKRKEKLEAIQLFNRGKADAVSIEPALMRLYQSAFQNQDLIKLFINIQYRIAQANGWSTKKIDALNAILLQLGFAPLGRQKRFVDEFSWYTQEPPPNYRTYTRGSGSQYQSRSQSHSGAHASYSPLSHAYALLAVNPNATQVAVKKAYRQLISRNHPDKLIAKGLSEAAIKDANEKTQKIRKAYELICTSKGWQH